MRATQRSILSTVPMFAAVAMLGTGCGFGSAGIVAGVRDSGTTTRIATTMTAITPDGTQTGRVVLRIALEVDRSEAVDIVDVEYSMRGAAGPFRHATPGLGAPAEVFAGSRVRGEDLARLDPRVLRYVWNSHRDLDDAMRSGELSRPLTARAMLRVTLQNTATGQRLVSTTGEFLLDQSLVATVDGGGVGDGTTAATAAMLDPVGIASDLRGNLFVADSGNQRIRRITTDGTAATGIETVVGNGFEGTIGGTQGATATSLSRPVAVAVDRNGDLYIAEAATAAASQIRFAERATGLLSPLLGGFAQISSLHLADDRRLFIADEAADSVWSLDLVGADLVLLPPTRANLRAEGAFAAPSAVYAVGSGAAATLYVAERGLQRVARRRAGSAAEPVAGGGILAPAIGVDARTVALADPAALAATGTHFFVADRAGNRVLCVDDSTLTIVNVLDEVLTPAGGRAMHRPAGLALRDGLLHIVETGDGTVAAGQRGHQVLLARNVTNAGAAVVTPFAAGDSDKTVATAILGAASAVLELRISQNQALG